MENWDILPANKNARENKPALFLIDRKDHSAELKAQLSVLKPLKGALYVEIFVNKDRNEIKLSPKKEQTVHTRNVTTDGRTWVCIGGGQLLRDYFEVPFGKYVMTETLVFRKV